MFIYHNFWKKIIFKKHVYYYYYDQFCALRVDDNYKRQRAINCGKAGGLVSPLHREMTTRPFFFIFLAFLLL